MGNEPQGAGWWQASDGRWYPPEQHPEASAAHPAAHAEASSRTAVLFTLGLLGLGLLLLGGALLVGMLSDDEPTASDARNEVGGSMNLEGDIPADAICNDLPQGCTPRPTASEAATIEAGVAAVYPGVPAGKATDWAISVCSDIRAGRPESSLVRNIQMRYAGGSRPDPTTAQAEQILDIVRSVGFCTE